jgi:hypothetical protein
MFLFFFLAVFHSLYLVYGSYKLPDAALMLDTAIVVLDKFPVGLYTLNADDPSLKTTGFNH